MVLQETFPTNSKPLKYSNKKFNDTRTPYLPDIRKRTEFHFIFIKRGLCIQKSCYFSPDTKATFPHENISKEKRVSQAHKQNLKGFLRKRKAWANPREICIK